MKSARLHVCSIIRQLEAVASLRLTPETEGLAASRCTSIVLAGLPANGHVESAADPLVSLGAGRPADAV